MSQRLMRFAPGILLAAGLLAVAGVWAAGLRQVPLTVRADVLYQTQPLGEISVEQTAGQTITAPYDGLYRVDVSLADYRRMNTGPVVLRVWSAPPGDPAAQVVAQADFPAEAVVGDVRQAIAFAPIGDSAGRQYYLELSSPQIQPGGGIAPYYQPMDTYPGGTAYLAGEPIDGDLVFVLHFQTDGWERVSLLVEQMLPGKPRPLRWAATPVLLAAGYMILAAAAVWGLGRTAR
jgi:hypothetical protein